MKKIIVGILSTIVLVCLCFGLTTSAATKADVLKEAAKSPVYKYVQKSIENAAKSFEVTAEQADQLVAIIKDMNAVVTEDNGQHIELHKYYTDAQIEAVKTAVDKACKVLNCTVSYDPILSSAAHDGDIVLKIYDASHKLVFEYDSDVKNTAGDTNYTLVIVGSVVLLAAVGAFVFGKKRILSK